MFHKLNQVGETKKKQMKENQKQGELTDEEPSSVGISSGDRAWPRESWIRGYPDSRTIYIVWTIEA